MNVSLFRFKILSSIFLALTVLGFTSTAFAQAQVDIELTSSESDDPVVAGSGVGNLTYIVTATNNGPDGATGVEASATVTFPAGVTVDTVTPSGTGTWSATLPGTWTIGDLANGASETLTFVLTADSSTAAGTDSINLSSNVSAVNETDTDNTNDTTSQATSVERGVDIELSATKSIDPVVAGSGMDNLVVELIAVNNGPDDATGLVVDTVYVLPLGVIPTSIVPSQGTVDNAGVWTVGDLTVAQGAVMVTATLTVSPITDSGIDVISGAATVSAVNENDWNPLNDTTLGTVSVRETIAIFRVGKIFTDGNGASVNMTLTCNDVIEDTGSVTGGDFVSLTATGFLQDGFGTTNCVVSEEIPSGYFPAYSADCDVTAVDGAANATDGDGVYACTVINDNTQTSFNVIKTFSDGNTADVEVTLTCNTGLPLVQSFDIAGGDPEGVNFVVAGYLEGTMDCDVTETGSPDGYAVIYDNCSWDNVLSADAHNCVINNIANAATFTVTKKWEIFAGGGGNAVIEAVPVTAFCDNQIAGGAFDDLNQRWYISDVLGNGDSLTATVNTILGPAHCWAEELVIASGVESEDDCGLRTIQAGESSSCTFTNTVFFEGIPTLSQYGLAILALLMLGVGMVGFRRLA